MPDVVIVTCGTCLSRVAYVDLEGHKAWHAELEQIIARRVLRSLSDISRAAVPTGRY